MTICQRFLHLLLTRLLLNNYCFYLSVNYQYLGFTYLSIRLTFSDTLIPQSAAQKHEDLNLYLIGAVSYPISAPVALARSPEAQKNYYDTLTPKVKLTC